MLCFASGMYLLPSQVLSPTAFETGLGFLLESLLVSPSVSRCPSSMSSQYLWILSAHLPVSQIGTEPQIPWPWVSSVQQGECDAARFFCFLEGRNQVAQAPGPKPGTQQVQINVWMEQPASASYCPSFDIMSGVSFGTEISPILSNPCWSYLKLPRT